MFCSKIIQSNNLSFEIFNPYSVLMGNGISKKAMPTTTSKHFFHEERNGQGRESVRESVRKRERQVNDIREKIQRARLESATDFKVRCLSSERYSSRGARSLTYPNSKARLSCPYQSRLLAPQPILTASLGPRTYINRGTRSLQQFRISSLIFSDIFLTHLWRIQPTGGFGGATYLTGSN